MNIIDMLKGKEDSQIEEIISSQILSMEFYKQIDLLLRTSNSFFLPIIRSVLDDLLVQISLDESILDYHELLESYGYESTEEREALLDSGNIVDLEILDYELAERIIKIGDAIRNLESDE